MFRTGPTNNDSASSVLDILKSKHPAAQPASADALVIFSHGLQEVYPVIFDRIDTTSIHTAALNTKGAASHQDSMPTAGIGFVHHSSQPLMTCAIPLLWLQDVSVSPLWIPETSLPS